MTIKDVSTSDAELTLTGEFLDFTAPGLFAYWTRPDTRICAVVVATPGIVSSKATTTASSAAAAQAAWICKSKRVIVSSSVSICVSNSVSTKL